MVIRKPVSVLQVVGAMWAGGIETWLVQVLRRLDQKQFQVDILTHTDEECFYDKEVRSLGARLIPCLHPSQPWRYIYNFRRILKEYGPYDVVHSHVFRYSGLVMRLAAAARVPLRLVHSHTMFENRRLTMLRRGYNTLMNRWLNENTTDFLTVSPDAAAALFGLGNTKIHLIPPGINLVPFQDNTSRENVKKSLGFPLEVKILGHVGRFEEAKNHFFFLDVAQKLSRKDPNFWFLLVGDGSLRNQVEARALELGLADRVVFAGLRSDVPRLLKGAVDLLLFPSKWEGFGRVIVEAQAAGVPCLISDVIPPDVDLVQPLVRRLSLVQPPEVWAEAAWDILQSPPPISREAALQQVEESPFNIVNSVRELEKLYLTAHERLQK